MSNDRLKLALSQIKPGDWERFEEFASEFLTSEFPDFRNMATQSGDKGRDGELYNINNSGDVKLQFSVSEDWSGKINATVRRLEKTGLPRVLIYVTNQDIGAQSDQLKSRLIKRNVSLDIRDCTYFIDRRSSSESCISACQSLERAFVDPLLASESLGASVGKALSTMEERIAFLHLSIEMSERTNDRNLTKLAIEALILSILHGSSAENPMPREAIIEQLLPLLKSTIRDTAIAQVDSALDRLSAKRGRIKYRSKEGSYHVSHGERQHIDAQAESFLSGQESLEADIHAALYLIDSDADKNSQDYSSQVSSIRKLFEYLLLDFGEQFSIFLTTATIPEQALTESLTTIASNHSISSPIPVGDLLEVIEEVCVHGNETTQRHLRKLLDAYTTMALLQSTSDVQKTMRKIFTGGRIWLDTSVVLPLLVETMYGVDSPYTHLVEASRAADVALYVTPGVVEEVDAHLTLCVNAARSSTVARIPYVLGQYIRNGGSRSEFYAWQEEFRGLGDPIFDIQEFLSDEFNIKVRDLADPLSRAPKDLYESAERFWDEVTETRRGTTSDPSEIAKLARHDLENTVGVLQLRGNASTNPVGDQDWLLTEDRHAKRFSRVIGEELGRHITSPVINPQFLAQLVRFKRDNSAHSSSDADRVPIYFGIARSEPLTPEIAAMIDDLRSKSPSLGPRRTRRFIREQMNQRKAAPEFSSLGE